MANTQNYGFSLPQGWGRPGAAERRRDHTAVDKAIKAVADNAATRAQMTAAQNRIAALEGRVEVRYGSYMGDGAATRTIKLGFTPKAVLLEAESGMRVSATTFYYGGLALTGLPATARYTTIIEIVQGGFQVTFQQNAAASNSNNTSMRYIALKG